MKGFLVFLVIALAGCAATREVGHGYARAVRTYGHGLHQLAGGKVVLAAPREITPETPLPEGYPVYRPSQCIGAIVNGVCHGSVMGQPVATCHGEMLNGQCTGPMF